ncbi:MAG TPA: F0F1 ATP synthase subunit B [bacterium]
MLLEPHLGTLFWTTLTFVLLAIILKKLAWKPILQTLEDRERRIREALEKAEATQKETAAAMVQHQANLETAKREAQDLLAKSRKTAEATKEEILQKAQSEANNLLERAKREISLEREKAVEEIRKQTAELSVQIASKLIGKSLSKADHKQLIEESLKKMVQVN